MIRFHIMAGKADQAKSLAHQMGLSPKEWRHISKWEDLLGLRGGALLVYGTWADKNDAQELICMAKQRDMSVLYIN